MYKNFQIKSNYDQLKLDGIIISCENPKGIVQISHGMCEHREIYRLYEFLIKSRIFMYYS